MLVTTGYLIWDSVRIKTVSVDDQSLYVSNYKTEIAIPLSQISNVTESRWLQGHPVTVHLKSPSAFGDKIRFLPIKEPFLFLESHPVVGELKTLAGLAHQSRR